MSVESIAKKPFFIHLRHPENHSVRHSNENMKKIIIRRHASCLESHGERLVAPPVRRQHRAEEVGTVGADQLAGVVRQDVHHVPVVRP